MDQSQQLRRHLERHLERRLEVGGDAPYSVSRRLPSGSRVGYEDPVGRPLLEVTSRYTREMNSLRGTHEGVRRACCGS
eukprot:2315666-Pyramimonas_sp.AAC.1